MNIAVLAMSEVTTAAPVDVGPFLRRRKDRKLLSEAAILAIPAAKRALGTTDPQEVGLYLGVGREPPEDATEAAIVAGQKGGELDVCRLGELGLPLYPPLASLRTLPNLVLAHVAIQLGVQGDAATRAGDGAAGLVALAEAAWAVQEGRCTFALAGASDSWEHPALRRDMARRGIDGVGAGAAAFALLAKASTAERLGVEPMCIITQVHTSMGAAATTSLPHHRTLGRCGAADGILALVRAMADSKSGELRIRDETGAVGGVCWRPPAPETSR
ncbi:MAG: beta-ketoacyl synthase N-terminal-like domain-containing protein [Myxococcota bacterium]